MAIYRYSMAQFLSGKAGKKTLPKPRQTLVTSKISTEGGGFRCSLCYREGGVLVESELPLPYSRTAVAYAACRYIRRCPELRELLIPRAVRMGLGAGARSARSVTVRTSAAALELPGGSALLTLEISAGTLTLKSVKLRA